MEWTPRRTCFRFFPHALACDEVRSYSTCGKKRVFRIRSSPIESDASPGRIFNSKAVKASTVPSLKFAAEVPVSCQSTPKFAAIKSIKGPSSLASRVGLIQSPVENRYPVACSSSFSTSLASCGFSMKVLMSRSTRGPRAVVASVCVRAIAAFLSQYDSISPRKHCFWSLLEGLWTWQPSAICL